MSKLTRWDPSHDLWALHDEMDRVFGHILGGGRALAGDGEPRGWVPAADVRESDEGFTVRLDLPGVTRKDVKVTVSGDALHVRGERRQESTEREATWHRYERVYGSFERIFNLGVPLQADKVNAVYKDGVLEIQVPKAESVRPREVEIKVSGN